MTEQKPFVLWSIKRVIFFGTPGILSRKYKRFRSVPPVGEISQK